MGTSSFGLPTLKTLVDNNFNVVAVYTQPPRPAGRGKKITLSPIGQFATNQNLNVLHPENFTDENDIYNFQNLKADLVIVVAYGLILPARLLATEKVSFFNIHASILPRWRGAAPIQRALLMGDSETGVCIINLETSLDTGPVVLEKRLKIMRTDNAGSLHEKLSLIGSKLTYELCQNYCDLNYVVQKTEGVTYAKKIEKNETRIDWDISAESVANQIRAFSPAPGAWFELGGERIKILESCVADGKGVPGEVIDSCFQVACKSGSILPMILQRSGRSPLSRENFLRGYKVLSGSYLS